MRKDFWYLILIPDSKRISVQNQCMQMIWLIKENAG
jgi:hypothetical protein